MGDRGHDCDEPDCQWRGYVIKHPQGEVARVLAKHRGAWTCASPTSTSSAARRSLPMRTADDRKKLRELAEKATPGPWSVVDTPWGNGDWIVQGTGDPHGRRPICDLQMIDPGDEWDDGQDDANATFIAAANPDAVKALLDQVERLERERDEAIGAGRSRAEAARLLAGQESRLRGRIERLERVAEYAKHTPLCWDLMFHDERPCSCGLDAARSAVADRTKEG